MADFDPSSAVAFDDFDPDSAQLFEEKSATDRVKDLAGSVVDTVREIIPGMGKPYQSVMDGVQQSAASETTGTDNPMAGPMRADSERALQSQFRKDPTLATKVAKQDSAIGRVAQDAVTRNERRASGDMLPRTAEDIRADVEQGTLPMADIDTDSALSRGINEMASSSAATYALAKGDINTVADIVAQRAMYRLENPASDSEAAFYDQWRKNDVVTNLLNLPSTLVKNPGGVISAAVSQTPNMVPPMTGMLAGGAAGAITPAPGGAYLGMWGGATAGNSLVEGGGKIEEALAEAKIDPRNKEAVKEFLSKNRGDILIKTGIKSAVIGAIDTATMGLADLWLKAPAKAAVQANAKLLTGMGVDLADRAAVQAAMRTPEYVAGRAAIEAAFKAQTSGVQNLGRNIGVAALEPAGEFSGEYFGEGLATGKYDANEAMLEAVMSVGQSAATFAGQKAYAAASTPRVSDILNPNATLDQALKSTSDYIESAKLTDVTAQSDIANIDQAINARDTARRNIVEQIQAQLSADASLEGIGAPAQPIPSDAVQAAATARNQAEINQTPSTEQAVDALQSQPTLLLPSPGTQSSTGAFVATQDGVMGRQTFAEQQAAQQAQDAQRERTITTLPDRRALHLEQNPSGTYMLTGNAAIKENLALVKETFKQFGLNANTAKNTDSGVTLMVAKSAEQAKVTQAVEAVNARFATSRTTADDINSLETQFPDIGETDGVTPAQAQQTRQEEPQAPAITDPKLKVLQERGATNLREVNADELGAEVDGLNTKRMSKWRAKFIQRMVGLFGRKVKFYSSDTVIDDGMNDGGDTLYINVDAGVEPISVAGHEWRHSLKTLNEDAHNALNKATSAALSRNKEVLKAFVKYYNEQGRTITRKDANDEDVEVTIRSSKDMVAALDNNESLSDDEMAYLAEEYSSDITGKMWRDPAALKEVFDAIIEEHPPTVARSIIKAIGDSILSLLNKLIASTPKSGFQTGENQYALPQEDLIEIRNQIKAAMKDAFIQIEKKQLGIAGEARFSPKNPEFTDQTLPTRWPTGKDTNASINDDMVTDIDTLKQDEVQYEKAVAAVVGVTGMHPPAVKSMTLDQKLEYVIGRLKDNILWLHDMVPADARERTRLWYQGARKVAERWAEKYHLSNSQAAGMLAVLSPQKDWYMNVTMTERIIDIMDAKMGHMFDKNMRAAAFNFMAAKEEDSSDNAKTAKNKADTRDAFEIAKSKTLKQVIATKNWTAVGVWLRAYDEAYHGSAHTRVSPEGDFLGKQKTKAGEDAKRAWGSFDSIGKAASVFVDGKPENINEMIGGEHKVRNFYNNIFAPNDPRFVTIDTHAVAADTLHPVSGNDSYVTDAFGATGGTKKTGLSGSYAIHYEAYQRAAKERGILPREMQSITWEAVRMLFEDTFKTKTSRDFIDGIWSAVDAGNVVPVVAREWVHDYAEKIDHPDWWYDTSKKEDKTYAQKKEPFAGTRITFEVAPNPDDKDVSGRWNKLPFDVRANISRRVAWRVIAKAFQSFGKLETTNMKGEMHEQIGGYLDDTNTSFSIWLNKYVSGSNAGKLVQVIGHALRQKEMVRTSPRPFDTGRVHRKDNKKQNITAGDKIMSVEMDAIAINIPDAWGSKEIGDFYLDLRKQTGISGHTTVDGQMVILSDNGANVGKKIDEYTGGQYDITTSKIYVDFADKGDNDYDLKIKRAAAGGSKTESSLLSRANQLRAFADGLASQLIAEATDQLSKEQGLTGFPKFSPARSDAAGNEPARGGAQGQGGRGYGSARSGAVSAVGVHYSNQERAVLDSSAYGRGLKGAERQRVAMAKDFRLRQRVYFYINNGQGINPEAGVGSHAHSVSLNNLYDMDADSLDLFPSGMSINDQLNAFESAVIDAGFDGYLTRNFGNNGAAVLLGEHSVPVEYIGQGVKPGVENAPARKMSAYEVQRDAVINNKGLPSGQMNGAAWKRLMASLMPEVDVSHLDDKTDYYKDQIVKKPSASFSTFRAVDTESPKFKRWSRGLPVVSMEDSQAEEFGAGKGYVVKALHGTTGDVSEFKRQYANIESDLGGGFYFTNTYDDAGNNYAGEGPDLTGKLEREAERHRDSLEYDDWADGKTDEDIDNEAWRRARISLNVDSAGVSMPVYVRFENPVVLGGSNETFLDYNEEYNEELDEYGEPSGKLLDVIEALRDVTADERYGDIDVEQAIGSLMDEAYYGGISADRAIEILTSSKGLQYATDYEDERGGLANKEIVRKAFEQAGFDGFIDQTVNKKFGSEKRVGKPMAGMDQGTVHYIAFKPTQIKSAISNTGEFSSTNPDIRYSPDRVAKHLTNDASDSGRLLKTAYAAGHPSTAATAPEEQPSLAGGLDESVSPTDSERKFSTNRKLADDLEQQQVYLTQAANDAGYKTIDEFAAGNLNAFLKAAENWRAEHPEEMLLSTNRLIGDSGRQYTPEQKKMFEQTGRLVDEKSVLERLREWVAKRWKQGIFDQFAPFRDIDMNAYTLMRLSKGATGAFEAFMKHGKLSLRDSAYDADTSGGVINDVFIPLGKETTDFLYWIAGNRAERLAAQGLERLFSPQDIAAAKDLDKGTTDFDYVLSNGNTTRDRTKIYADALVKFNAYGKNVLDMAEQSGLIDGAARKLWEHEFYVPFYRVMEDDTTRGMGIKKGIVRQEAFKKLKGGDEKLGDLLSNTLMNWAHLIDASSKNRAAKAAVESAERVGLARPAVHGETKTVWYMDGGDKKLYKIDDPAVLEAITGLEYAGMKNMVMDVMTKPKHWLTVGVTASPFFKVRNLIRDSIQAIATSDLSYNAIGNVMEGYRLTNRDRQEYVSALAGGGLIRFGTMLEGNEAARVRQLIKQGSKDANILAGESSLRRFYDKWIEPGVSAYNELGNRGEEINRMSLYDQLIKQGVDHATASLMARDLMDFSLQGSFTTIRFLAQVVPFFNARVQGLYKLGRATKENREHMAIVTFTATLAGLALMALAGRDDDEWKKWKERPEHDKANYWYFRFAGTEFRIPRPFELGAVAFLGERTVEALFDSERDAGKRYGKAILDAVKNQLSMNPVPQAVKPIVDLYANRDSFRDTPIETLSMQRLDKTERYTANTSMPARWASNATGGMLSPVQYDHLVQAYFGWMGATAVATADLTARAINNEPAKPSADMWKLATGGMVREDPVSSRYVSMVYEQAAELEQAHATYNKLRKDGKLEEAAEYKEENADKLKAYRSVENVKKQETKLAEKIRIIERSNMHPAEKRIKIRALRQQQSDIASRLSQ